MKLTLFAMTLSAFICVLPTHAAPGKKTQVWESLFFPAVKRQMCSPHGSMTKLFKITPRACRRTFRYAAKYCRQAAHQVPFYSVQDAPTGTAWGKWLGMCIGTAYDMKYTYRQPIP